MYDKLVYSVIWLGILLWSFAKINQHGLGGRWTFYYWLIFVATMIQVALVLYHGSDAYSRHRMWQKLKGKPQVSTCPHGDSWDDCPDCRH